jgi:hypothetical protein
MESIDEKDIPAYHPAICLGLVLAGLPAVSQSRQAKPTMLEEPMPDFTLPLIRRDRVPLFLQGKTS